MFKLIEEAISIISKRIKADFYFTDSRTQAKVVDQHPGVQSFVFNSASHAALINYIITIGGDGTILYAAK